MPPGAGGNERADRGGGAGAGAGGIGERGVTSTASTG